MIDLLGFRDRVRSENPSAIMATLQSIDTFVRNACMLSVMTAPWNNLLNLNSYEFPDVALDYRFFSDTVVIFSAQNIEGEGLYESDELRCAVIELYYIMLLKHSLLMRGSIVLGELYVDGNVIFGKDLIRAYEDMESQDWGGITILDHYGIMNHPGDLYSCEYDVPYKSGRKRRLVLNLFAFDEYPDKFDDLVRKVSAMHDEAPSGVVAVKLKNTLEYFRFLQSSGKRFMDRIFEDPATVPLLDALVEHVKNRKRELEEKKPAEESSPAFSPMMERLRLREKRIAVNCNKKNRSGQQSGRRAR